MLLSIRVEAEFAEERTEDLTTTTSQLRRLERGGFLTVYDDTFTIICMFVCDYRSRIYLFACMDVCACLIGHVCRVSCICRVLPEPSRTGWSIRPWWTGLGQASRTGGSL